MSKSRQDAWDPKDAVSIPDRTRVVQVATLEGGRPWGSERLGTPQEPHSNANVGGFNEKIAKLCRDSGKGKDQGKVLVK